MSTTGHKSSTTPDAQAEDERLAVEYQAIAAISAVSLIVGGETRCSPSWRAMNGADARARIVKPACNWRSRETVPSLDASAIHGLSNNSPPLLDFRRDRMA